MQPILGMRKNLLHRFRQRNSAVHAHVFVPVKKWEKYSDADRNRILQRLNRFADAYRTQYRENGLLHLPLRYEIRNGTQICVEKCDLSGNIIPTASVHHMALFQVDILFRSLLMQLRQLESIRFIHGAISPETVVICPTPKVYSAAVTDITAGRFADEPVLNENLVRGSCMSPETCRAVKYPYADQEGQATDIFSAGCLYYQYLTGAVLDVGDSPVSPAEAIWLGIPVSVEGIYGFRASLIRWMLLPGQDDRPAAAVILEAFAEAEKRNLLDEGLPGEMTVADIRICAESIDNDYSSFCRFAYSPQGEKYIARILHRMWPVGANTGNGLFVRQKKYLERESLRLDEGSERSRLWHKEHPGIDCCFWEKALPFPVCWSALSGEICIPLKSLREYESSVFILDARMTELLFIAATLHDDDYILGIISEKSFYVSLNPTGSQVHYIDAVSAISLFSVPCAWDLAPDRDEVRIMSPEMCTFIATQSETEAQAYQLSLSPASDVFALGMLYHLILTGKYPQVDTATQFDEAKPYGTYSNAICHASQPEKAIVLDHTLDRKHSDLIRRMIAINPLDRISDCRQIANMIMSFYTE